MTPAQPLYVHGLIDDTWDADAPSAKPLVGEVVHQRRMCCWCLACSRRLQACAQASAPSRPKANFVSA